MLKAENSKKTNELNHLSEASYKVCFEQFTKVELYYILEKY